MIVEDMTFRGWCGTKVQDILKLDGSVVFTEQPLPPSSSPERFYKVVLVFWKQIACSQYKIVLRKGLPDVHVFLRLRSCRLQLSPFSLRGPSLPPFLLPRFPAESGLAECVCPSQRYPLWLRERATDRGDDGGGGERGPEAREMEGCTLG